MLDAMIVSDIHLGSRECRHRAFWKLLKQLEFGRIQTKNLIVNGDLFDSEDMGRLSLKDWKVIRCLRALRKVLPITFVRGNHDGSLMDLLFPESVCDFLVLSSGGRRIFVTHGHLYDEWLAKPWLEKLSGWVYRAAHLIDPSETLPRLLKYAAQRWIDCPEQIAKRACQEALEMDCFTACCGHTHFPAYEPEMMVEEGPVRYANGGSFTETPSTYLSVSSGQVRIEGIK